MSHLCSGSRKEINMSLLELENVFKNINSCNAWSIQLLKIKTSKKYGTSYIGREISLCPRGKLHQLVNEIAMNYIDSKKGILSSYTDITEYDGSAVGTTIYSIEAENPLIENEYKKLITAISEPDTELNPLELSPNAYLLKGIITIDNNDYPIKLVSMQCPITTLKHKFAENNGSFTEISDKVLSLKPSIDVIIWNDTIYLLTLSGENLFNMERSYKNICSQKIDDIIECDFLIDINEFTRIASSGHNPRRFISFNENRFQKLKNQNYRLKMAEKFSIPIIGNKFDTTKDGSVEKIVKLLCNKGMVDPFEDTPVEVAGAKQWI